MDIRRIAPVGAVAQPLTTAEAKLFLRVDGSDEDAFIDGLVAAAADFVADMSWSSVTLTQWQMVLPDFPGSSTYASNAALSSRLAELMGRRQTRRQRFPDAIRLPRGPVRSVQSIAYRDSSGELIAITAGTLAAAVQMSMTDDDCLLAPVAGTSWPSVQAGNLEGVVVNYTAGFDGDDYPFPTQAIQAVRMLIAHWYENRETVLVGTISKEIEASLSALCSNFDQRRFNPGR